MQVILLLTILLTLLTYCPPAAGSSRCPEDMALIPEGAFAMGDEEGPAHQRPVHEVRLDAFCLDRTLVTNRRFAEFLNAKGNRKEGGKKWLDTDCFLCPLLIGIKGKAGAFRPKEGQEEHPVVKVTWHAAKAFCGALGKTLPTEAQWEKAARGGMSGKRHPWGDAPDGSGTYYGKRLMPVGTFPPNGYGLFEMTGNIWQWVEDWYDPDYYSRSPASNPTGPSDGGLKVLRGGSWFHEDSARCAIRGYDHPKSDVYCFVTGFR